MTATVRPGDWVRLEQTRGWLTANPTRRIVEGVATVDDEGTLRVADVNVTQDADGYFPEGVLPLNHPPHPLMNRQPNRQPAKGNRHHGPHLQAPAAHPQPSRPARHRHPRRHLRIRGGH